MGFLGYLCPELGECLASHNFESLGGWDGLFGFEFESTAENTDTHHGEKVVGGVRMVINTSEECGGSVFANVLAQQMTTSRMFVHERRDIMNETGNEDERAGLGLFLEAIPGDDGKIVGGSGPLEVLSLSLDLLELHGNLALADFVIGECLEMRCEAEERHGSDEPLGGVVLIPFDGITVVHGELMVEVVVTFTDGDESGEDVVTRSVLVIERRLSEPVSEGVYAKGGVMDEDEPGSGSIKVSTFPVTPADTRDDGWDNDGHEDEEPDVVLVLPADEGVVVEIRAIGDTGFTARLDDHPADVRPQKTVVSTIGVQVGIGITMMGAMAS